MLKSLARELKALDITTIIIEETDFSIEPSPAPYSLDSAITDNIIELKSVRIGKRRTGILNVLKTRSTDHDGGFYEMESSNHGAAVGRRVIPECNFLSVFEYAKPERSEGRRRRPKAK